MSEGCDMQESEFVLRILKENRCPKEQTLVVLSSVMTWACNNRMIEERVVEYSESEEDEKEDEYLKQLAESLGTKHMKRRVSKARKERIEIPYTDKNLNIRQPLP